MNFIELDHTSSGVQIAAALTRDANIAPAVNITAGDTKGDLYTVISTKANAAIKAAGIDFPKLVRKDVKTAVISKIYGASHLSVYSGLAAATGITNKDSNGAFKVIHDVIKDELGAVVSIEAYFQDLVKAVHEAGHNSVTITIPGGVVFTVDFRAGDQVVDDFCVNYKEEGEHYSSTIRGLEVPGDVNVGKAARELTAGYIQGLDAYILAAVQAKLGEAGIYFLAKHDAYIIDEANTDALKAIVKDVFYDIFKDDHLNNLYKEVTAKYGNIVSAFVGYGAYNINDVLAADFIIA